MICKPEKALAAHAAALLHKLKFSKRLFARKPALQTHVSIPPPRCGFTPYFFMAFQSRDFSQLSAQLPVCRFTLMLWLTEMLLSRCFLYFSFYSSPWMGE